MEQTKGTRKPDNSYLKPLSERPVGYFLAFLGGALAIPFGFIASPLVLMVLNKSMSAQNGKPPNRFSRWALIGCVAVPLNIGIIAFLGNLSIDADVKSCNSGIKDACKRLVDLNSSHDRIRNSAFHDILKENKILKEKEMLTKANKERREREEETRKQIQENKSNRQPASTKTNKPAISYVLVNEATYEKRYGEPWPLKTNNGKIYCFDYQEVVLEVGKTMYAINGNAAGKKTGEFLQYGNTRIEAMKYSNINEIRKYHPDGPIYGLMSVSPMLQEGLKLCRN